MKFTLLTTQMACISATMMLGPVVSVGGQQPESEPVFSIGAVADVQYADSPPRGDRTPRESPRRLQEAVDFFNAQGLDFVVNLGDFIDWDDIDYSVFPKETKPVEPVDWTHFETVNTIWQKIRAPRHHVLGNHDVYVPDRASDGEKPARVLAKFGFKDKAYYDFSHKGFRFIMLDGTDRYMYSYPAGSPAYGEAKAYFDSITTPARTPWNGAISDTQLAWLADTLADATSKGEKVVVCCHFPIHDPVGGHTLLNFQETRDVLDRFPNVVLWLNGHNHAGGYALANEGKPTQRHHLNLMGMQNADDRHYRLVFHPQKIEVFRAGNKLPERTMHFTSSQRQN